MAPRDSGRPLLHWSGFASLLMTGFLGTVLAARFLPPDSAGKAPPQPQQQTPLAGRHSGSAFAIADGMLVTNAHVTLRCRAEQAPISVDGHPGTWRIAYEDPALDLALLSGPKAGIPALPLSATPRLPHGARVMLLGYPMSGEGQVAPGTLGATQGTVEGAALTLHKPEGGVSTSFVMTDQNGHTIEPTWADGVAYFGARNAERLRWVVDIAASAGPGESGGPVIDGAGNVVGVIFAGDAAGGHASAVTLDDLRTFLAAAGIVPGFAEPAPAKVEDWDPAFGAAASSVVHVTC
ncbi:MAG TPA: serine protease [Acetobacteraceae bacterium]|nr:serine protease [Acetobacteraceae bacterium]